MKKKETVCAVVVTYNRKELLLECLEALRKQTRPVQGIYLIDNASTDGTPELLLEKEYIKELPPENLTDPWEKEFEIKNLTDGEIIKLHYVRMHENTGGAGGFHEGVKRAYEKGYDWLWLMDDDCYPVNTCLQDQINNTKKSEFSVPLKISSDSGSPIMDINMKKISSKIESYGLPFNGFLVSRVIISIIGYPKKEFYIDRDDIEFNQRARKFGFKGYIIPKCIIKHPDDKSFYIKFLFFSKKFKNYGTGNKIYYKVRNTIYIGKYYKNFRKNAFKTIIVELLSLFFAEFTFHRFKLFSLGILDGIREKLGKLGK